MLHRKLLRELSRQRASNGAVLLVTALGVALFAGSYAGYLNLRQSYAETRQRLALADFHASATSLTAEDVRSVSALPGVAQVELRREVPLPVHLSEGRGFDGHPAPIDAELRTLELPAQGQPQLDRLQVLEGQLPAGDDELALEAHFAHWHHLHPGASLTVGGRGMRVSGVAVSAEYLWVTRSAEDLMPSPTEFGVGWMRGSALDALAPSSPPRVRLLVSLPPGSAPGEVRAALEKMLGSRLAGIESASELPGVRLLQLDVDGLRQMALFFPLLFLGVGALVMASILGRMVDAQRPLIGTLLALGVPRSRVLGHYLAFAVALGLLGAGLGVALAEVGSGELTRSYAEELAIPFVSTRFHPGLDLGGVLLAAGVAALAGFLPARRAAGLSPVEAMRPGAPRNGWATGRLFRPLARLPLPARLAARGVLATPLRSLTSAGGVTAAVVLLLTTTAITDGMTRAVDVQFHQEERYDLRAEWNEPRPAAPLRSQVGAAAPGSTIEVGLAVPATLRRSTRSAKALVEAVEPHATLLKTLDENGRSPTLGPGEVALPHSAAHALDCRPGDVLTLDLEPWARPVTVRVGFIRDGVMGSTLNARLEDLRTWLGAPGAANFAVLATPSERREATRLVLFTLPGVARVHDAAAMRGQLDLLMGLSYAMVGAMALFGAILAAAIVFNTSTLSILERSREFATLRALGLPMRKIRAQVTLGNGALALLGAALGLPLAVWTARAAAASLDSDLFSVTAYLSPRAMLLALLEIAAVLLLGQWPALRTIARANLAEAVRSREG